MEIKLETSFSLVTSFVFLMLPWVFPSVPKYMAISGFVSGVALACVTLFFLNKPNIGASILFIIGALLVGYSFDLWFKQNYPPSGSDSSPKTSNSMGKVDGNSGVISQGQSGNNTINK